MSDLAKMFVGPGMTSMAQAVADAKWGTTKTTPAQENSVQLAWAFDPSIRAWKNGVAQEYGEQLSLSDPFYDTRGAILAGLRPHPYAEDGGRYHWGSVGATPDMRAVEFKSPGHPTRWMQSYAENFGSDPLTDAASGSVGLAQRAFFTEALRRALER